MTGADSVERVETTSVGPHGVRATVRGHVLTTDRPHEMGGEDRGLMASEHVLVGLASCTTTTALKIAAKRSVVLHRVDVAADMHFNDKSDVERIHLTIRVRTAGEAAGVEKVFELAERVCTISRILRVPITRDVIIET